MARVWKSFPADTDRYTKAFILPLHAIKLRPCSIKSIRKKLINEHKNRFIIDFYHQSYYSLCIKETVEKENIILMYLLSGFSLSVLSDISRGKCGWGEARNGTLYHVSFEGIETRIKVEGKIREKYEKAHYQSKDGATFIYTRQKNDWKDYWFVCFPFRVLLTTSYGTEKSITLAMKCNL